MVYFHVLYNNMKYYDNIGNKSDFLDMFWWVSYYSTHPNITVPTQKDTHTEILFK